MKRLVLLVAGIAASFGLAGVASAAATTGAFYNQETIVFPDSSLCTGLDGTTTNTITEVGHMVDTGTTTHVVGTTMQDYRSDWSDGTYLISHSPSHFAFDADSTGTTVFTEAQQDRGTLYAADGHVLGYQNVFTLTHLTWRDGKVGSGVSNFRVSCP
jgi:hypothetical protein